MRESRGPADRKRDLSNNNMRKSESDNDVLRKSKQKSRPSTKKQRESSNMGDMSQF